MFICADVHGISYERMFICSYVHMFICSHVHVYIRARVHMFVYKFLGPVRYGSGLGFRFTRARGGLGPWAKTPKPQTPKPQTPNPKPQTPNPKPVTPDPGFITRIGGDMSDICPFPMYEVHVSASAEDGTVAHETACATLSAALLSASQWADLLERGDYKDVRVTVTDLKGGIVAAFGRDESWENLCAGGRFSCKWKNS